MINYASLSAMIICRFFLGLVLSFSVVTVTVQANDSIVAIVNDEIITKSQILSDLDVLKEGKQDLNVNRLVLTQLLDQRILYTIQLQQISKFGINVSQEEVNRQIENVARQNNITTQVLKQTLDKQEANGYQAFVKNVRDKLNLDRLRKQAIFNQVNVSDAEVEANLQLENAALYRYKLRNIFIQKPDVNLNQQQLEAYQKRVTLLYQALEKNNTDFAQLARRFSDARNSKDYGDMGMLTISEIPNIYKRALNTLKVGDVSKIIQSSDGLHIIKLEEKTPLNQEEKQAQTHIRHILIAVRDEKEDQFAKDKIVAIRKQLMTDTEQFANLAKQYSDDVTSKHKGGDLGWVDNDYIHPAFVKNMVGSDISAVFKTEFGWHIAQKIASRVVNETVEKQKEEVRQMLQQQKSVEAFSIWLENLRAEAYIEKFEDRLVD